MALFSSANFGVNLVNAFSNAALPLFLGKYGLPNVLIGFLAQERSFVGGFVQPVVGIISDHTKSRLGRRRPFFLIGVTLTSISLLLLATHPPLWTVIGLLIVLSFFLAVANDPYLALMADITPERQRGRMGSVMAVFNMSGQVAMLAVASIFWESDESWVFLFISGGLVLGFLVTFFAVHEPTIEIAAAPLQRVSPRQYVKNVLRHREVAKFAGTQFFFWLGNGAAAPFLTRFGVDVLGVEEGVAFQLVMIAVLSTAIAAVPVGFLADRWGKKQTLSRGLLLFTVVALVGSQAQTVPQAMVMMACLGLANAVTISLAFPLLADLMPADRKGEFMGLGSLVWSLAQPLGSTWAGFMVDFSGSFRTVFVVAAVLIGVSFLGLQRVHPERVRSDAMP